MGKIVYCPKCANFWCVETDGDSKCPKCSGTFVPMGITKEEWDSYTQEQKDGAKKAFLEVNGFAGSAARIMAERQAVSSGYAANNNTMSKTDAVLSEMNSSFKSIAKDFHFFKVLSVVWMIALGVIFVLSFFVEILAAL